MSDLDPASLSHLYRWIDTIPLDRPKKNIARDFSDGVLMSQVLHYFFPKLVELHNYSASNSIDQKNYNWKTLNQKVFKKMGFMISPLDIEAVVQCKKHAIERILLLIQAKIGEYQAATQGGAEVGAGAGDVSPVAAATPVARPIPPPAHVQQQQQQQPAAAPAAVSRKKASGPRVDLHQRHQSQPQVQSPQRAAAQSSSAGAAHAAAAPAPLGVGIGGGGIGGVPDRDSSAAIHDLRETVDILQLKVQKLEQLLRLKNTKIESLQKKLDLATATQPHH